MSARAEAVRVEATVAAGGDPGPLAGVSFAVKNLLDVAGLSTLAGSGLFRERPPTARDAAAVRALTQARAILVGTLNMDEFAYGFTTENSHYGPARNPHDLARVSGGSSGGSGAAVWSLWVQAQRAPRPLARCARRLGEASITSGPSRDRSAI